MFYLLLSLGCYHTSLLLHLLCCSEKETGGGKEGKCRPHHKTKGKGGFRSHSALDPKHVLL